MMTSLGSLQHQTHMIAFHMALRKTRFAKFAALVTYISKEEVTEMSFVS
jgi:hypothetical protein